MTATTDSDINQVDAEGVFYALLGWSEVEDRLQDDLERRREVGYIRSTGVGQCADELFLLRAVRHPRAVYRIIAVELGSELVTVVERGFHDRYWRVRWTAAQCKVAPPELLAELVGDTSPEVRCAAARNKLMPLHALRQLLVDRVSSVRVAAAWNPSFVEADLCALTEHPDPAVRRVIAQRLTTVAALEFLAGDPDVQVAETVASNASASARALHLITHRTVDSRALSNVALHGNTEVRDQLTIIQGGLEEPLLAMARRSTVPEVLNALAQHSETAIRVKLLTNRNVTAEALMLMPLDAPVAEHRVASAHANATFATCRRLAVHYLASGHRGRRNIGLEMVRTSLAKGTADITIAAPEPEEPFDIVHALLTGQCRDALLAWAKGTTGPKWLRGHVLNELGCDDVASFGT